MGCGASKSPAVSTDEKPEMRSGIDETVDVAAVPDTASVVTASEKLSCEDVGAPQTLEYRRFLQSGGAKTSFWHDVPLYASRSSGAAPTFNVVIEITRQTTAKMEMATTEAHAPIKQDTKKGKLRDYAVPIEWNYGAMPRTWEQPAHAWAGLEHLASKGDNDPLDVVDLSTIAQPCGAVVEVKLVAVLAMIDEGEVDWKVVVINVADPKAALLNSLADAEAHFPGEIARVKEWFTWYKAVDGKPGDGPLGSNRMEDKEPNVFGFDGAAKDARFALSVVEETHACWAKLLSGACEGDGLSLECAPASRAVAAAQQSA